MRAWQQELAALRALQDRGEQGSRARSMHLQQQHQTEVWSAAHLRITYVAHPCNVSAARAQLVPQLEYNLNRDPRPK